jgi:putative endonuclease
MSRAKGDFAEQRGVDYLQSSGYTVLQRNFYSRFGEIDIIAIKDETLHFVEVKSGDEYELAIQNITPKKLSKIVKTAHVYMKKKALDLSFSIDALIVTPQNIEFLQNITI